MMTDDEIQFEAQMDREWQQIRGQAVIAAAMNWPGRSIERLTEDAGRLAVWIRTDELPTR